LPSSRRMMSRQWTKRRRCRIGKFVRPIASTMRAGSRRNTTQRSARPTASKVDPRPQQGSQGGRQIGSSKCRGWPLYARQDRACLSIARASISEGTIRRRRAVGPRQEIERARASAEELRDRLLQQQHAGAALLVFQVEDDDVHDDGIDVSYETVRRWALKFGAIIARKLRRGRSRLVPLTVAESQHRRALTAISATLPNTETISGAEHSIWADPSRNVPVSQRPQGA
jgi:hypothetical protein